MTLKSIGRHPFRFAAVVFSLTVAGMLAVDVVRNALKTADDFGYQPNPEGVREFLMELDEPMFTQAGEAVIEEAKGVDTFLYRAGNKAHEALYSRPWVVERQGIGDCTSWGWAHSVWLAQCVDWETGKLAQPPPFPSTEAIYGGSRVEARGKNGDGRSPVGGYSDGSYGGACAKWVRDWGIVYRVNVGGHDLRAYSADRAKAWGAYGCGGQGDGGKLDAIAKAHPAKHVALVRSFKEAAAAIESGYPIAVCSMQGFASVRDDQGFAAPRGSWAHCMAFIGVRYEKNGSPRDALLCLNSWGPSWISGPSWPADMPRGSFWVDAKTVDSMLRGGDSFAVGSVEGFKPRDLHNGDWLMPAPQDGPSIQAGPADPASLSLAL